MVERMVLLFSEMQFTIIRQESKLTSILRSLAQSELGQIKKIQQSGKLSISDFFYGWKVRYEVFYS